MFGKFQVHMVFEGTNGRKRTEMSVFQHNTVEEAENAAIKSMLYHNGGKRSGACKGYIITRDFPDYIQHVKQKIYC